MRRLSPPSPAMAVALLALFVALGGTGYAVLSGGIPDKQGVFHGCVNKKSGALRLTKTAGACKKKKGKFPGEFEVQFSQKGPAGVNGTNGTNGSTVTARLRGTTPVTTSSTSAPFAMSPSSWSQAADAVDQLVGSMTYHAPSAANCTQVFFMGSPPTPGQLSLTVKVDGQAVGGLVFQPADGNDHTVALGLSSLFEPGAAATHNLTVEVSDNCGNNGGVANEHFRVDAVKIDVLSSH